MEQTKSFMEHTEEEGSAISVFEPDYTSDFKSYFKNVVSLYSLKYIESTN